MTNGAQWKPLYTKALAITAFQVVILSAIFAAYDVEVPIKPTIHWIVGKVHEIEIVRKSLGWLSTTFGMSMIRAKAQPKATHQKTLSFAELMTDVQQLPVLTKEQLTLFDGSRPAKPVYLAILGRIYNVDKGRKHYAPGGGYHFFSGKDATRAFVTGDFTEEGLTDDISGLSEQELLSVIDWLKFYEKDYKLVGVLQGSYYNADKELTERGINVVESLERAQAYKDKQLKESEVFPPCNSEWQKEKGGRVWCSTKSGGVKREWVGVPRKLFSSFSKTYRCACVKNFGPPLALPGEDGNRGDLDNPNLREYDGCSPSSNSCKLENE
jgi:predicted heme/steroid binding protein